MLEIILLIWLCRKMGALMATKGRRAIGYQFMVVGMWFGGEIIGGITGAALGAGGARGELNAAVYLFAIIGAIAGVSVAFVIANTRPAMGTYRAQGFDVLTASGSSPPPPGGNWPPPPAAR